MILDGGRGMERVGWVGSITWFRENLRPPSSINNHALAVGLSRGVVVAAAIALLALAPGITSSVHPSAL
jgi:NhaP-type Na+/H+ or K+/H+ antiporter